MSQPRIESYGEMPLAVRIQRDLDTWSRFFHIPVLGFSLIVPLLGAATVKPGLSTIELAGLLGAAILFHNYGYISNDVIDLPVDRTQILRSESPLVTGRVRPKPVLLFALAQIPLAFALTLEWGGRAAALVALTAAFVLMTVYNVWGKRTRWPVLTDLALALSCGLMAGYGAWLVSGQVNALTITAMACITFFVTMMNGVHGGLRDLANDLHSGAHSTALWFGARPLGSHLTIPLALRIYMLCMHGLLVIAQITPLVFNWFNYDGQAWAITLTLVLVLNLIALGLSLLSLELAHSPWDMVLAGTWQLVLLLSSILALYALYLEPKTLVVLLAAYLLPTASSGWLYTALARAGANALERLPRTTK